MDSGQYATKSQGSIPPLGPLTMLGELQYTDGAQSTSIKAEIHGLIDKGFFLSDGEWTCYRRNYFSCVCSYTLSPYYNTPIRFTPSNTSQPLNVHGFAMCISAVVADTDSHPIELVQHTPKRDKGPVAKPERVRLSPKVSQPGHHAMLYGHSADPARGMYSDGFGGPQAGPNTYQTEHTFERIQFKQATANNGKRRAAQQYYHLLVELWADVGQPGPDQFVKVAYKKSAKMIVRGRSPGHYQSERRGSTSSGPGGATGSMSSYSGAPAMGSDYGSGNTLIGSGYPGAYDTRGSSGPYSSRHHHSDMPPESLMSPEEAKAVDTTKGYQYYPHTIYEGQQDSRPGGGGVDMFTHQRGEDEVMASHMAASGYESTPKIKSEYEANGLPSLFHAGPLATNRRCGQFEGKARTEGYYPSVMPQSSVNLTNA
jgi:meiosis-specific transcription factor NDT80